jgi:hypothetical protein
MIKKGLFGLLFILLLTNFLVAQEKKAIVKEVVVETQDAASFGVQAAKLTNFIIKNNNEFQEKLQLSFELPKSFETSLARAGIILTAYKEDGRVSGKHIWPSVKSGKIEEISGDILRITFDVNSEFEGAHKYSLTLIRDGAFTRTSCQDCVELAKDTCGRGSVKSVNCGADGSCSFSCK